MHISEFWCFSAWWCMMFIFYSAARKSFHFECESKQVKSFAAHCDSCSFHLDLLMTIAPSDFCGTSSDSQFVSAAKENLSVRKTLGLVFKGSKNVAKCSFLLLFLELHRHFASSRSDHQTHIVKFHPLWWRAMKMLILWDFYETRNLCFFHITGRGRNFCLIMHETRKNRGNMKSDLMP